MENKFKRVINREPARNPVSNILDRLHMDLATDLKPTSVHGHRYMLIVVDEHSRYTWTIPLFKKSDAPIFIKNLILHSETQHGKPVKSIRTDNGTEFVNQELERFFNGKGIVHQKSCPGNPHQNGIAERRIGLVKESIRTMLNSAKLPGSLWPEAMSYATSIINDSYSESLGGIPSQIFTGNVPDLKRYKVFGCVAYCQPDGIRFGSFSPKAVSGIYLGSLPLKKGALVFVPSTQRWVETPNIRYDETKFLSLPTGYQIPPNTGRSNASRFIQNLHLPTVEFSQESIIHPRRSSECSNHELVNEPVVIDNPIPIIPEEIDNPTPIILEETDYIEEEFFEALETPE
jgi:hypothetical protein